MKNIIINSELFFYTFAGQKPFYNAIPQLLHQYFILFSALTFEGFQDSFTLSLI